MKDTKIEKTVKEDLEQIAEIISKEFKLSGKEEALWQLSNSKFIDSESVKLIDPSDNSIKGVLVFCDYPISIGSPIKHVDEVVDKFLSEFKGVNGHSFIIDEEYRDGKVDKEMLLFNLEYLATNYDFIWCGVDSNFKTHNYWKRLGFVELLSIPEATFYILPLSKKILE